MQLPKYIKYNLKAIDSPNTGTYLLCTYSPFSIFKIWTFPNEERLLEWCDNTHLPFSRVNGYLLAISYVQCLDGTKLTDKEIEQSINECIQFVEDKTIPNQQGYYNRFKI